MHDRQPSKKFAKKQTEVDQTSFPASKPGTSSTAVNLDIPPPRHKANIQTENMDVNYFPALPPRLVLDPHDTSDQYVAPSELPPKKFSDKPKKHSHSRSRHEIESRSASDQSNEESDEPQIPSTKPKKHSDKSKHKSRSRYVSSSSEEDQSPVARHRSSKPSGAQPSGAVSDQDLPQHDPDPPYYREVALSDIPSRYAEEVDTFRRILSLPDPRESMPRSSREEAPTGNAPIGATPHKAVTNRFSQEGGNQTSEASGVIFDPIIGEEGVETPLPNDSSKASLSPPVGGRLRSFRRDWQTNKCSPVACS